MSAADQAATNLSGLGTPKLVASASESNILARKLKKSSVPLPTGHPSVKEMKITLLNRDKSKD